MRFDLILGASTGTNPTIGDIVATINARIHRPTFTPIVGAIALGITILLFWIFPPAAFFFGIFGGTVVWQLHRHEQRHRTTTVNYRLDTESDRCFSAIQTACRTLAIAQKIWVEEPHYTKPDPNVPITLKRQPVNVIPKRPPCIQTNMTIWCIDVRDLQLFFFPNYVLMKRGGFYSAVPYSSLEIQFNSEVIQAQGSIPDDAEFIGWSRSSSHVADPASAQVRYGLLKLVSNLGFSLKLHISNYTAAETSVRHFRSVQRWLTAKQDKRSPNAPNQPTKKSTTAKSAYDILGVQPGVSLSELKAAYYRVAKQNHPDRVSGLAPEFQELATRRIKEINAAYIELRNQVRRTAPPKQR